MFQNRIIPEEKVLPRSSAGFRTIEISCKAQESAFLTVPERVYKSDRDWIPQVKQDVSAVFDPAKNPYFRHGATARWVVVNHTGDLCGRIAAFINFQKLYDEGKKVGCIGFFECIPDQDAAFVLFDTAIDWLIDRYQVDVVDGPVNFGENDKYWGLLINGFGPVSFGMNYNPPYYQEFFEDFGFHIQYKQLTNYVNLSKPLPERFTRIAERIIHHGRYSFRPFRYSARETFIDDFVEVYNRAWSTFKNFHPMDKDVVRKSISEMRLIMEEDFIWFAYEGGRPVALFVAVPDVNEIIRYSGGDFNWWGKCKFLFYKYIKGFSTARVVIMGIVPEHQRHGLESALIFKAFNEGRKRPNYKHVQLAWVGDFNEKMIAIHRAMEAIEYKQHATYRKVLVL